MSTKTDLIRTAGAWSSRLDDFRALQDSAGAPGADVSAIFTIPGAPTVRVEFDSGLRNLLIRFLGDCVDFIDRRIPVMLDDAKVSK